MGLTKNWFKEITEDTKKNIEHDFIVAQLKDVAENSSIPVARVEACKVLLDIK